MITGGDERWLTLPNGLWQGGEHHRDAALRPLCGADELAVAGFGGGVSARMTALLARCALALGSLTPPSTDTLRLLTVGDRAALALKLRALSYGARMDGALRCPRCDARLDLDLNAESLLLPPLTAPAPVYEVALEGVRVMFRLPTGDDESVTAGMSVDEGERELLRRCIVRIEPPDAALSEPLLDAISQAMLDCDPQAEMVFEMDCPECGAGFSARFDPEAFLLREIEQRGRQVYREVHTLALAYHWSEAEILALPHPRRQMYLSLLDEGGAL
jgi:hypothetical protein